MAKRFIFAACWLLITLPATGCAPVLVGGGAAGGYAVATDERSTGRQVDDAIITTRIKSQMVADAAVKARDIDVDTVNGVVSLKGFVDSTRERERAEVIARSVPGVTSVHNNLQIGSRSAGQILDDKNIGVKIKAKLIGEPGIRSLNVDVDVYRNVVYLTGTVENALQKTKIIGLAKSTPGVARIVDYIKVMGR